ncbi:MAG: hypothetical protein JO325_06100 [Solirubrobacterales bacterium]|nr:hypothetical protein [Solirubrobacterales bacterium]
MIATLLCTHAGTNIEPLTIVGVVVAYIVTLVISSLWAPAPAADQSAPSPEAAAAAAAAAAAPSS